MHSILQQPHRHLLRRAAIAGEHCLLVWGELHARAGWTGVKGLGASVKVIFELHVHRRRGAREVGRLTVVGDSAVEPLLAGLTRLDAR